MARTFPQPEKKETPTQKLKRELAEAEAQRDGYQKEASDLRKQINGKLEETDSYKNLVKQVDSLTLDRNTAIKQRDRYHAKVQQLEDERDTLRKQLADLQATYEAQSAAESVPDAQAIEVPKVAQNGTQGGTEAIVEPLPENIPLEEWQQDIIEKLKAIYENQNQNLKDGIATKILRIWSATLQTEEALKLLYDYFLAPLPYEDEQDVTSAEVFAQLEAQENTIKGLKAQISDTKNAEQYNNAMSNYETISKQSKKIKELKKQLDASVTAQNALKSDLDKLVAEYTQATRHNARNAGRKPKLTADQEQEIKNLRSEGFNVRQIAAKMSCSTGLVCKILKNCINS